MSVQPDVSTRLSEAGELFARSVSNDKSFRSLAALNYFGQIVKPDGTHVGPSSEASDLVVQWIRGRFRI
jgi:hypothetical protein